MVHAKSTADGHIVAKELSFFGNRDEAEILGEDIDIVGRRDGEAGLEFARQVGVAIHRLVFRCTSGDEFLIEIDLVIGAGLGKRIVTPSRSMGVNLLKDGIALGIGRCHDIAVHITAGGDGIEQDRVHSLHELFHISFEDAVELKGLTGGESQGGCGDILGELIQDAPLLRSRPASGESDAEQKGEGLFLAFLLQDIALIAVILNVEAVKFAELITLLADAARGRIGNLGGDVAAQMTGVDLHYLVDGKFRGGSLGNIGIGNHGFNGDLYSRIVLILEFDFIVSEIAGESF